MRLSLRAKEILTGVVVLVLVFGSIFGAEAVLRVQQFIVLGTAETVEQADAYDDDPITGLRLPIPNARHGKLRFNARGFRGPDIGVPKPDGTVRVAFLGASTTLDPYVVADDKTWPALTVAGLRKRFPTCAIDYLNAGAPGLTTANLRRYYEVTIGKTQPDIVVLLTTDLNVRLKRRAERIGLLERVRYTPSWLGEVSLFWGKVEKNAFIVRSASSGEVGVLSIGTGS